MTWIASKAIVHTYYEKETYKHICATKNLKQLSKEHKFNQLFAHGKSCKFALFARAPPHGVNTNQVIWRHEHL